MRPGKETVKNAGFVTIVATFTIMIGVLFVASGEKPEPATSSRAKVDLQLLASPTTVPTLLPAASRCSEAIYIYPQGVILFHNLDPYPVDGFDFQVCTTDRMTPITAADMMVAANEGQLAMEESLLWDPDLLMRVFLEAAVPRISQLHPELRGLLLETYFQFIPKGGVIPTATATSRPST